MSVRYAVESRRPRPVSAGAVQEISAEMREQMFAQMVAYYKHLGVLPLIEFSSQLEPEYRYNTKEIGIRLTDRVYFGPSNDVTPIETQIFHNKFNEVFKNAYILENTQRYISNPERLHEPRFKKESNDFKRDLYAVLINIKMTHWVSFVFMKDETNDMWYGLYFDSFGDSLSKYEQIEKYVTKLIDVLKKEKSIEDKNFVYYENMERYQYDGSECGVWALYFVLMVNWFKQTNQSFLNIFDCLIIVGTNNSQKRKLRNAFFVQQKFEAIVAHEKGTFIETKKDFLELQSDSEKTASKGRGKEPEVSSSSSLLGPTISTDREEADMAGPSVPRAPTSQGSQDTTSSDSHLMESLMKFDPKRDRVLRKKQPPQEQTENANIISLLDTSDEEDSPTREEVAPDEVMQQEGVVQQEEDAPEEAIEGVAPPNPAIEVHAAEERETTSTRSETPQSTYPSTETDLGQDFRNIRDTASSRPPKRPKLPEMRRMFAELLKL